jgi:hypothetical protein
MGGAAMTTAYTVVVAGPSGHLAVYWDGDLAYLLEPHNMDDEQRAAWTADVSKGITRERRGAVRSYGAKVPTK